MKSNDVDDVLVLTERVRNTIALGESHFQEFKSALEGRPEGKTPRRVTAICRDIGEALVAFANADGGALVIGVEDDGTVTGIPHGDDDIEVMLKAVSTHVYAESQLPLLHVNRLVVDGYTVLYFSVGKGTTQIFQLPDGRCVRRSDLQTVPESVGSIVFERQESRSRAYDSEFIDDASVSDLDLTLVRELSDQYLLGITPEKYLQQIGLAEYGAGGLRLRRAAVLVFGKAIHRWHPRSQVRILRVRGNTLKAGLDYNVVSDELIQGNVIELLTRSWEALRPSLAYRTDLGVDTRFEHRYLFPEWACRETLVNAIAHRDYSTHVGIDCFIFDDRMEIKSPGALLTTLTIDLLKRLEGAHESRNALVARTLREARYMRELGEGMKRIFQLMQESDLQKPDLETDSTSFTVTLYQRSVFSPQQLAWLDVFSSHTLTKAQQRIIIAGMHDRALAPQDIYRAINTEDRDTYDREVTSLRNSGILLEIRTNPQATQLAKKSGKPKGQIPRFRIQVPNQGTQALEAAELDPSKVVVFGLPHDITQEELRAQIEEFGEVAKIDLPKAQPHFVTRFAFVTFVNIHSAASLLHGERELYVRGQRLRLEPYKPRLSSPRR